MNESSIDFEVETDPSIYSDTRDTNFSLKLQLFKALLFDAFKIEKSNYKAKTRR